MKLDVMKDQRNVKVNLCVMQRVEATTSKQPSIPLALQINSSFLTLLPDFPDTSLNRCPTVEQLLEEEIVSKLLLKLLSALKKRHGHKDLSEEDKSVLPVLASFFFFLSK